jgi:hypothetical protein
MDELIEHEAEVQHREEHGECRTYGDYDEPLRGDRLASHVVANRARDRVHPEFLDEPPLAFTPYR